MHFPVLLIVPKTIIDKGQTAIVNYVDLIISKYHYSIIVPPYIAKTHEQLQSHAHQLGYTDFNEYLACEHNSSDINEFGDLISTDNPTTIYDGYCFGGRYTGVINGIDIYEARNQRYDQYLNHVMRNVCQMKDFIETEYDERFNVAPLLIYDDKLELHEEFFDQGKYQYNELLISLNGWKKYFSQKLLEFNSDSIIMLDCHL